MSAQPCLSIVIPSHQRLDLLARCLKSIAAHATPRYEVIVIDDGSANAAVTSTARGSLPCRVIRHERPQGFCRSANAGMAAAQGELVQLLNDDAELATDVAPALARFADPRVVAVAPLVLRWPGECIDSAGDRYDRGGFAQPRGRGQRPAGMWLAATQVDAASGCAAFYRRDAVMTAGGFPTFFDSHFEDVDLSLRLRRDGGVIMYEPECRVLHHGGATYRRGTPALIRRQSRNEEQLYWRNTAGTPAELLRHAAVLATKAIRRTTEGTIVPWLQGRADGILAVVRRRYLAKQPANSTTMH